MDKHYDSLALATSVKLYVISKVRTRRNIKGTQLRPSYGGFPPRFTDLLNPSASPAGLS
jgi:hypothetical protein